MGIMFKEPRKKFKFMIPPNICEIVAVSKRNDPCACVIANTLVLIPRLLEAQVYATVTVLIWAGGVCHRYKTPKVLSNALKGFDANGGWDLPPGEYCLEPLDNTRRIAAVRERARKRRERGDRNMFKKYPFKGKTRSRAINSRLMNLVAMRKGQ